MFYYSSSLQSIPLPPAQLSHLILNLPFSEQDVRSEIIQLSKTDLVVATWSPKLVQLMANCSVVAQGKQVIFKTTSQIFCDPTFSIGKFWVTPIVSIVKILIVVVKLSIVTTVFLFVDN